MILATPQALAALLRRDKEVLLAAWEEKVKRLPATAGLVSGVLRDDMPHFIDKLAEGLTRRGAAAPRVQEPSAAHGAQRLKIGLHLPEIVEEYRLLRDTVSERAEAEGLIVAGEGNCVVNDLIDAGIKTATQAYIEQRDAAESQRRNEYLKFIVHDLRSPLAAIYYAILLVEKELEQIPVSERVRSIHVAIKRNIERMRGLIVKLLQEEENLKTSGYVEPARESIELRPVAASAAQTLASLAAGSETRIANQVPNGLSAYADAELLERIFQNLISNAVEHSPKGEVVVGARAADEGGVECWVRDNGRGIAPELRQAVFDKFVTKPEGRGVGLGLAVVKQLVEAHGGRVDLESEPGRGTTVRFRLPGR